jgi:hypothetical protein
MYVSHEFLVWQNEQQKKNGKNVDGLDFLSYLFIVLGSML